jgi:predicted ATPase
MRGRLISCHPVSANDAISGTQSPSRPPWRRRRSLRPRAAARTSTPAALSAADQLLPALSRGLGLTIEGRDVVAASVEVLASAQLLVLDSAEHLVEAVAALVTALSVARPASHCTSRIR